MRQYAIFADDLTGAADTAAMFALRGWNSAVYLGEIEDTKHAGNAVTSYSLATRDISQHEVSHRWRDLPANLLQDRSPYLKVDSTLRGNVGVSIQCYAEKVNADVVLLCPAFPQQGRTVHDGKLFVNGDEVCSIPALLAAQGCYTTVAVANPVECLRFLKGRGLQGNARHPLVLVAAASSDEDLHAWAQLAATETPVLAPAGSAGLAGALANLLDCNSSDGHRFVKAAHSGRVLTIIGSNTPLAKRQCARLATRMDVRVVRRLPIRAEDWLADDQKSKPHLLWTTHANDDVDKIALPTAASLDLPGEFTTLIISGGDTAERLLSTGGCRRISIYKQLEPGVPLGEMHLARSWQLVLKSGSFGDEGTLSRLVDCLVSEGSSVYSPEANSE